MLDLARLVPAALLVIGSMLTVYTAGAVIGRRNQFCTPRAFIACCAIAQTSLAIGALRGLSERDADAQANAAV